MIGQYCGDSIPPSHVSSSNEILAHFQSDIYTTGVGFQMEYNPTGKQITSIQNNNDLWSRSVMEIDINGVPILAGFTNHTEFDYSPI